MPTADFPSCCTWTIDYYSKLQWYMRAVKGIHDMFPFREGDEDRHIITMWGLEKRPVQNAKHLQASTMPAANAQ